MSELVRIYEVSPRDGLQNESAFVSTADKIKLVDMISAAGFRSVEVTSFVSPKWVPQMADAADVMQGIHRVDSVTYGVLTPNLKGFEAALQVCASEIAVFVAASESFSRKNTNCSIDESFGRVEQVVQQARANNIAVRGYVSCVLGCPYEGEIEPAAVKVVTDRLFACGCYEVSLGDTIGHGTPQSTERLLDTLLKSITPNLLAGHFHDTRQQAVNNIKVCLEHGLRTFDSAMAGLGGCPYAPGASGNVDTSLLVKAIDGWGYDAGIDGAKLAQAAEFAQSLKSTVLG